MGENAKIDCKMWIRTHSTHDTQGVLVEKYTLKKQIKNG